MVLLTPVFSAHATDNWLPWQTVFVRAVNELYPGLKLLIVSFHFPGTKQTHANWQGNDIYFPGNSLKGKAGSVQRWLRVWRLLKRFHKDYDIQGILSFFCSESAWIGHRFAKRYRLLHKIWILGQDARPENKMVRRIQPEAAELVCVSDFLQQHFLQHHGLRPEQVIPLGVWPSVQESGTARTIDILGAGSLIVLKQYDVFIEVVKKVQAQLPAVKAMICGDGAERMRLQQQLIDAGLSDHVSMPGYIPHNEVLLLMQQAKVFLHPSAYEGLGVVNLEALYAGAHVISFVQPLDRRIKNWHIVRNKEEMAALAVALLSDPLLAHESVLVKDMHDTAREMLALFGLEPGMFP